MISVSQIISIFLVHYLRQHKATCCKSSVTVLRLFLKGNKLLLTLIISELSGNQLLYLGEMIRVQ